MKITEVEYRYLPQNFQLEDVGQVEAECIKLLEMPIHSVQDLINYIYHFNELLDVIYNRDTQNYILMSLDTRNEENSAREEDFTQKVLSPAKRYFHQIKERMTQHPAWEKLGEEYLTYRQVVQMDLATFHQENIPLQEQENRLVSQYRKAISTISFTYQGEEKTRYELAKLLSEAGREQREEVWRIMQQGWLEKEDELNQLFDQVMEIRQRIAKNTGFSNFLEYQHLIRNRFDFPPEDLQQLHQAVEKVVVPALATVNQQKMVDLKVEELWPWDETYSTQGYTLAPMADVDELVEKTEQILERIDPDFAVGFQRIKEAGNLDLKNRPGKTPGGFCFPFDQTGMSFILMNAVGKPSEVNILLHESGHGIHAFAHADIPIRACRMLDGPGELTEFAAKTMEMLALEHYDLLCAGPEQVQQAKREKLINILDSLCRYAMEDAMEHWLYTHPNHSVDERMKFYQSLVDRYNPGVKWTGLEAEKGTGWFKRLLLLILPCYTISYALAQLGAIGVYKNYKENPERTLDQFKEFLALGFTRPIGELYETAGVEWDFSEEHLQEMIDFILEELQEG